MTAARHAPVRIPAAHHGAPLGGQQKTFNHHIEQIARQRELLADWQQAIDAYRERHAREAVPLQRAYVALVAELVRHLDAQSSDKRLAKSERRALSEAIAGRLTMLIDAVPDEATRAGLQEIHDRHGGSDSDAGEAEGGDMAGQECDADMDSPEDFMRRLDEQMQARKEEAERQREAHRATRRRKPGARERKAREAAAQATQSVREIYRKLASQLHPDRETDPAERERKTALMQRVNQAYAANRLLDLLQLQLEIEQITPDHIAGLSEERLAHYNRVLAEQLKELQQEVREVQGHFLREFGLDPARSLKPANLMRELRAHLQIIEYENLQLRRELNALRADPAALKGWIQAERQQRKARHGDMDPWS
ncbi:molecular chaperone DnaJ [Alicycliphilus denitrificans]|uniref:Molecular chaperone DnaJ n=1 Tax=Alicycliphilus denitrificans TaxID=179636 RepID=A0A858ZXG4_9BURK|nr:J domain-containing protein [Alicycliphilus denitrificans]ADV01453.1 heat shock protein DnaJ domain protein [Alicycliphilus denitrificans BC]QKD45518.1 molecular chaperone DnaJ [Alicycliphilus denitrificans]GAO25010.1 molecular chaperone DnaJ [Alicycliphilus sp. B1]